MGPLNYKKLYPCSSARFFYKFIYNYRFVICYSEFVLHFQVDPYLKDWDPQLKCDGSETLLGRDYANKHEKSVQIFSDRDNCFLMRERER